MVKSYDRLYCVIKVVLLKVTLYIKKKTQSLAKMNLVKSKFNLNNLAISD